MVSTNRLTDIYNNWGESNDLHPLGCATETLMFFNIGNEDGRTLTSNQEGSLKRFINTWEYAEKKEDQMRNKFHRKDENNYYFLKENSNIYIHETIGDENNPRYAYGVQYYDKSTGDGEDGGMFGSIYQAIERALRINKRLSKRTFQELIDLWEKI